MKKLLFILAAATLVACSEKVSLNESREIPIDFTKALRIAPKLLQPVHIPLQIFQ